jgi:hypothetical protein
MHHFTKEPNEKIDGTKNALGMTNLKRHKAMFPSGFEGNSLNSSGR